jgi:hypothetical protein
VLDDRNFSVDRCEPISRGGSFALREWPGKNTNEGEFTRLLWLLKEFNPEAARHVLARLRAGGGFIRG